MRVPIRKPGKYTHMQLDLTMTQAKLDALKSKLEHLKTVNFPKAIKETQQYGENGDFSENAEYQIAKGRLRSLNRQIEKLNYDINHATVIAATTDTAIVQIGHTVRLQTPAGEQTFQILGSTETNPTAGVISFKSPLGAALLGKAIHDTIMVRNSSYTILEILSN
jgi:transcription elongation GreA/GreB family factor